MYVSHDNVNSKNACLVVLGTFLKRGSTYFSRNREQWGWCQWKFL